DQLHRDVELVLRFAEVVKRDEVGMLQDAGGAGLAQEALTRVPGLADAGSQELEGDEPPDDRVVRLPHDAHRPFADEVVQLELADTAESFRFRHRACERGRTCNVHVAPGSGNKRVPAPVSAWPSRRCGRAWRALLRRQLRPGEAA